MYIAGAHMTYGGTMLLMGLVGSNSHGLSTLTFKISPTKEIVENKP